MLHHQYFEITSIKNDENYTHVTPILSSVSWDASPVINGVQPTKHQNGLSSNGETADFEEIIKLSNHSASGNSGQGQPADPIMAFEGGEPFMMKAGPMKPQHVAGEIGSFQIR